MSNGICQYCGCKYETTAFRCYNSDCVVNKPPILTYCSVTTKQAEYDSNIEYLNDYIRHLKGYIVKLEKDIEELNEEAGDE